MSTGERVSLDHARELCARLIRVLDYGGRIEVAGSVQRGKADVGDLELVIDADQTQIAPSLPSIDTRLDVLVAEGVIQPRLRNGKPQAWGERYKAAIYEGVNLDLWLVRTDRNFETVWLIRTGPGDANKLLVTRQSAGGCLPEHLGFCEGDLWRVDDPLMCIVGSATHHALITPFLAVLKNSHSRDGKYTLPPLSLNQPLSTIVASASQHALITPFLTSLNHSAVRNTPVAQPFPAIMPQVVPALIEPEDLLNDCGFRMLEPEELKRGMSFLDAYIILGNKRQQVKQVGNAVACNVAQAIVERCVAALA